MEKNQFLKLEIGEQSSKDKRFPKEAKSYWLRLRQRNKLVSVFDNAQ